MTDFYRYHLFFCTQSRPDSEGKPYCQQHDAQALRDYAKQRIKTLRLRKVRVNTAGCLNRCTLGPIMVIYPEGIWYRPTTEADIDEIIESHLINGEIVERLRQ